MPLLGLPRIALLYTGRKSQGYWDIIVATQWLCTHKCTPLIMREIRWKYL